MPSTEDVFNALQAMIVEQIGVDPSEVIMEATLVEDLGMTDTDIIGLWSATAERFGIEIPDDLIDKARTVGDMVVGVRDALG